MRGHDVKHVLPTDPVCMKMITLEHCCVILYSTMFNNTVVSLMRWHVLKCAFDSYINISSLFYILDKAVLLSAAETHLKYMWLILCQFSLIMRCEAYHGCIVVSRLSVSKLYLL